MTLSTKIAFIKEESELLTLNDNDYVSFDDLNKKEQEEIKVKLQVQFIKSMGAKNIRLRREKK